MHPSPPSFLTHPLLALALIPAVAGAEARGGGGGGRGEGCAGAGGKRNGARVVAPPPPSLHTAMHFGRQSPGGHPREEEEESYLCFPTIAQKK